MLFTEPPARQKALAAYADLPEATLRRAKSWAVLFGLMMLDTGLSDNPRHAAIGERILRHVPDGPCGERGLRRVVEFTHFPQNLVAQANPLR